VTGQRGDREERKAAARQMREQGYSFERIARLLSVSPTTVKFWFDPKAEEKMRLKNGTGIQAHKFNSRKPVEAKQAPLEIGDAEIIDLARRGYGKQAIAAILKCPYAQVEKVLR
jgi:transposase-like protein